MPHSNKVCEDNTAFLENRIKHLEAENLRLTERVKRYQKAFSDVPTAINDAITKLYPEECSKKTVLTTEKRCRDNGGTLAYLVNVRMRIEAILAESDSEPKPGEGEKP